MGWFEDKVDAFVGERVDAMGAYVCTICGDEHVALELAFRGRDVAVGDSSATPDDAADRIELDGRTYIRGPAHPVYGSERDFAIGLWLELDSANEGSIANRWHCSPRSSAHDAPRRPGRHRVAARRSSSSTDAHLQRDGVEHTVADRWRSDDGHRGSRSEPSPIGARWQRSATSAPSIPIEHW